MNNNEFVAALLLNSMDWWKKSRNLNIQLMCTSRPGEHEYSCEPVSVGHREGSQTHGGLKVTAVHLDPFHCTHPRFSKMTDEINSKVP
jgi:hypothetical protein